VPEGEEAIRLYSSSVSLRGNLERTGTALDHTLFFTFETAAEIARRSHIQAEQPLVIPEDSISAVLVRVQPGVDSRRVALRILRDVPDARPIEGAGMFRTFRGQIARLLRALLAILGVTAGGVASAAGPGLFEGGARAAARDRHHARARRAGPVGLLLPARRGGAVGGRWRDSRLVLAGGVARGAASAARSAGAAARPGHHHGDLAAGCAQAAAQRRPAGAAHRRLGG